MVHCVHAQFLRTLPFCLRNYGTALHTTARQILGYYMNFGFELAIDITVLVSVSWFVIEVVGLNLFNPGLLWVVLHFYAVTLRLLALAAGYQVASFAGVLQNEDLIRAALADDLALVAIAAAIGFAALKFPNRFRGPRNEVQLDPFIGKVLSVFCIFAGTFCLLAFGFGAASSARENIGALATTSYPLWIAGFAVEGAVIQCALYGFTPLRIGILFATAGITSIRLHRTNAVLPILMAILIYHAIKGKKWINTRWAVSLALMFVVFFGYKPFQYAIVTGNGFKNGLEEAKFYLQDVRETGEGDSQFLDEQATFMAAADDLDKRFYGATVLPLFYLPIPRYLWPDKPSIAQFAIDLTTPRRPIATTGMTALLVGESYVNFGWLGCFGIPFLYMLAMMYGYYSMASSSLGSTRTWLYLTMFITMIQVYRDGLNSIVLFGFVIFTPMVLWPFLSMVFAAFSRPSLVLRSANAARGQMANERFIG